MSARLSREAMIDAATLLVWSKWPDQLAMFKSPVLIRSILSWYRSQVVAQFRKVERQQFKASMALALKNFDHSSPPSASKSD
jgi:hypothetical protein